MDSFHRADQVVCLTTALNPAQAHIWANELQEEGVHCQVVGDYLGAGIGDISGVQAEIWVKRQDLTQAQAVLQRCSQSEVGAGEEKT
jgi:Putative prokaryotic signal transducing protein